MQRCEARGVHKEYNFIRNVYCSLPVGHEGRHIAYWNNLVVPEWLEEEEHLDSELGEIGGLYGGHYYDWYDSEFGLLEPNPLPAPEG